MFIGHYAVAAAGRGALQGPGRAPSLGTWFLAVQWLDLVWPLLVLAGIERVEIAPGITALTPLDFVHYPWTHSLAAALVWGALFAVGYRWRTGDGRAGLWLGGGVFSHWVLDWFTHRADLPLYPGGALRVGLGLWDHPAAAVIVEGALFAAAVAFYARTTHAVDRTGRWAWWVLVAFLALAYVANLLGPPPPNVTALAVSALALWLLVPWAYWIDRHRAPSR